jgi:hypothetical protein
MGVIITTADKKASYAPMYEPDPVAMEEQKRVDVRKMDSFGEPEVKQIVDRRMKHGKRDICLWLDERLEDAYQLTAGPVGDFIVIAAPRYLAWEKGQYGWLLQELEGVPGDTGWVIGSMPNVTAILRKFVRHIA